MTVHKDKTHDASCDSGPRRGNTIAVHMLKAERDDMRRAITVSKANSLSKVKICALAAKSEIRPILNTNILYGQEPCRHFIWQPTSLATQNPLTRTDVYSL
jgi:hypothetical protein